jgi:hypothetical protein
MDYIFQCKHCSEFFIIKLTDFNCKILRHGAYKTTLQYINPHMAKNECDNLVNNNVIYGCGKPLRIIKINDVYEIEICDYI